MGRSLWLAVAKCLARSGCRFGSKADIDHHSCDVRFTPKSGHSSAGLECPLSAIGGHSALRQRLTLFDDLVGKGEQSIRDVQAKRLGSLAVDDQLGLLGRSDGAGSSPAATPRLPT